MRSLLRSLIGAALLALTVAPLAAQRGAGFGASIVVGNGEILAGEASNGYRPGVVYVYRKAGAAWREVAKLVAPDAQPRDGFGAPLTLDGPNLFVGSQSGTIHVFRKEGATWRHSGAIAPPADLGGVRFGATMAASGDWLLVGAVPGGGGRGGGGGGGGRGGNANNQPSGAVYAFQRGANGEWTQHSKLAPADASPGDGFGGSIALAGVRALIAAAGKNERAGVVYQFRLDPATRAWQEAGTLQPRGVLANEAFGTTVALEGDVAYIGAPGNGGGYGAAFLFRRDTLTGTWAEQSRLVGFSGGRADRFGTSIAANGRDVWVGAPGSAPTGSAYIYAGATADAFTSADLTKATRTDPRDGFGQAIALRGNVAAVGATALDFGAGGVFVFERNAAGQWRESATLLSPPDALDAVTGKEVLCNEQGKAGIFDCKNAELLSFLPVPALTLNERGVRLSGIWGWTDTRTNREYALVGRNNGTSFVDITDPKKPVFLGDLPMTPGARASAWREIKVYKDHAYIVSDGAGEHGMQVFDLARLRAVKGAPVKFEPTTLYKRINSAHNIVINEESGFAYSVGGSSGGETCGGGLHMMDIRDPKNPAFVGCFADPQTGRASTGYSHDAQCVNYKGPDERYRGREICLGSNETMLSIADVTDKNNPVAITRIGYPNVGYTHQGWLTGDQRYFYVNDELDETSGSVQNTRTLVWDLSRLDDPQLIKEFMGTTRASDHNLYVLGNTMYQSNYVAGLRLIDISNPREPVEVGFLDTAPFGENNPGFSGSWSNYPFFKSGTIAVASIGEGLFLVKKRDVKTVF